jgi:cobalt-zinc-cadmium efflux system membrane fusion protein
MNADPLRLTSLILPSLLSLLMAPILLGACRSAPASQAHPQPPSGEVWLTAQQVGDARITVAPVENRVVDNLVSASGRVGFDDLRVAHVFSPVTGKVTRILAEPGQRLKKGAPLAIIQSPDVGNAFSDLGKADADLIAAEHDFRRQQELYQAHAGSQKDSEAAEDNFRKAKAEMDRARQKARLFRGGSADAVTQEFTLRAPIDGEIVARNVNPGAEVQGQYAGGTAVELFTVGELDRVWVTADIFEMDLGRVKPGASVTIRTLAYPDRSFPGVLDWISDTLDPASRTARVRCAIANPERALKPEMYATLDIEVAGVATPALPRSAVLRITDQTIVFIADGLTQDGRQRFVRRVVALDEDRGGEVVPIVRGLALGERVVTTGGILLSALL